VRSLILSAFISLSISLSVATLVTAQQVLGEGLYAIALDVDLMVFNGSYRQSRHVSGFEAGRFSHL